MRMGSSGEPPGPAGLGKDDLLDDLEFILAAEEPVPDVRLLDDPRSRPFEPDFLSPNKARIFTTCELCHVT